MDHAQEVNAVLSEFYSRQGNMILLQACIHGL